MESRKYEHGLYIEAKNIAGLSNEAVNDEILRISHEFHIRAVRVQSSLLKKSKALTEEAGTAGETGQKALQNT